MLYLHILFTFFFFLSTSFSSVQKRHSKNLACANCSWINPLIRKFLVIRKVRRDKKKYKGRQADALVAVVVEFNSKKKKRKKGKKSQSLIIRFSAYLTLLSIQSFS